MQTPTTEPRPSTLDASPTEAQASDRQQAAPPTVPQHWWEEFKAAARRPLETRWRYACIHTHKPVLDDAPYRSFDTMADYRRWCEDKLPSWLGYGRV